ncbi:hypothetical protein BJ546DRAFT_354657 [Cryomyces antarcticus]
MSLVMASCHPSPTSYLCVMLHTTNVKRSRYTFRASSSSFEPLVDRIFIIVIYSEYRYPESSCDSFEALLDRYQCHSRTEQRFVRQRGSYRAHTSALLPSNKLLDPRKSCQVFDGAAAPPNKPVYPGRRCCRIFMHTKDTASGDEIPIPFKSLSACCPQGMCGGKQPMEPGGPTSSPCIATSTWLSAENKACVWKKVPLQIRPEYEKPSCNQQPDTKDLLRNPPRRWPPLCRQTILCQAIASSCELKHMKKLCDAAAGRSQSQRPHWEGGSIIEKV